MAHQCFLPFVGEANEHVLAGALQPFTVVLDEAEEAFNVYIVLEINCQDVPHVKPSTWPIRLAVSAILPMDD